VTTTTGHPSRLIYDWDSESSTGTRNSFPIVIEHRRKIERFSEKVTQVIYGNSSHLIDIMTEEELVIALNSLKIDLQELDILSSSFSRKLGFVHAFDSN
jgi:hypothetical protein